MKGFARMTTKTLLLIIGIAIVAAILLAAWGNLAPGISKAISSLPSTLQDIG